MTPEQFRALMIPVTAEIAGRRLDRRLTEHLNAVYPAGSGAVRRIEAACHEAIAAGWMCAEGGPGRRFGRVVQPDDETHRLSIDVVDLENVVGPHHRHPDGEICLVMPQNEGAAFDGHADGWCVYAANSGHRPTVTGGRALVLYLLPEGKIEFTGQY